MPRSTADWQALLDGATSGPWWTETHHRMRYANGETWEEIGDILICSAAELTPLMYLPEQMAEDEKQARHNLSNANLAALAPEAVAEVIRLRESIEKLAEHWKSLDTDTYQDTTSPLTVSFSEAVSELRQILRGA